MTTTEQRLRSALEFYRDEWTVPAIGPRGEPEPTIRLCSDRGRRAREALAAAPEDEGWVRVPDHVTGPWIENVDALLVDRTASSPGGTVIADWIKLVLEAAPPPPLDLHEEGKR